MTHTITLNQLTDSARHMGLRSHVDSIGGGRVALHFQDGHYGPVFLVTLDDGNTTGDEWCVGLADGSEDSGELPVTSDADQTMMDALAWARFHSAGRFADRITAPTALSDQALWLQFMIEDGAMGGYDEDLNTPDDDRHGALIDEVTRRFGPDATERTAEHAIACHMASEDLIRWARDDYANLIGIATGAIVPEWRRED